MSDHFAGAAGVHLRGRGEGDVRCGADCGLQDKKTLFDAADDNNAAVKVRIYV